MYLKSIKKLWYLFMILGSSTGVSETMPPSRSTTPPPRQVSFNLDSSSRCHDSNRATTPSPRQRQSYYSNYVRSTTPPVTPRNNLEERPRHRGLDDLLKHYQEIKRNAHWGFPFVYINSETRKIDKLKSDLSINKGEINSKTDYIRHRYLYADLAQMLWDEITYFQEYINKLNNSIDNPIRDVISYQKHQYNIAQIFNGGKLFLTEIIDYIKSYSSNTEPEQFQYDCYKLAQEQFIRLLYNKIYRSDDHEIRKICIEIYEKYIDLNKLLYKCIRQKLLITLYKEPCSGLNGRQRPCDIHISGSVI